MDPENLPVINNYLEASEPVSSEARVSRMHFHDNHRKVDYVLAYHYRKRGAHPGHGSPGHSLAIVSNGETGKDPQAGAPGDIELGPLDALEEERKEQREEFEHNLMEAGLELEKDLEVESLPLLLISLYRRRPLDVQELSQVHKSIASPSKSQGSVFVRIHAPWQVLAREAEFLKIKVPTKKVTSFHANSGEYSPLCESSGGRAGPSACFPGSSFPPSVPYGGSEPRAALAMYEIKSQGSIAKTFNKILHKLSAPLKPRVPEHSNSRMKNLSYPFSREKMYLYDIRDKDTFFDNATRSRIVHEILKRTTCSRANNTMGINSLIANNIYEAAYPLHDGEYDSPGDDMNDRKLLYQEWARYGVFYKFQPIDLIRCSNLTPEQAALGTRKYFGEKIGLYFAWLGLYTSFLIPSSVIGIIVFLYGCATIEEDIPSKEMCDRQNAFTMCPLCDTSCDYWNLSSACGTARASHLFDNPATVVFSIFMALWATMFLENWKRLQMRLGYFWDLTGIEEEELRAPVCISCLLTLPLSFLNTGTAPRNVLSVAVVCGEVVVCSVAVMCVMCVWRSCVVKWLYVVWQSCVEHSRPEYETKVREKMLKESNKSVVQKLGTSGTEAEDELKSLRCGQKRASEMQFRIFWANSGFQFSLTNEQCLSSSWAHRELASIFQNLEITELGELLWMWRDDEDKLTWKDRFPGYLMNFASILFMIALTFSIVFGVIVYRITTAAALSLNKATRSNVRVTVTATAVIINLVVILILDEIYGAVAKWLTKIEVPKTEQTFEERLILKAFLLKFVNAYSPIFYVAFFKGRFVGRPGSYVYVFDGYRMEEASIAPGFSCLAGGS
ncbi:hypothetical protein MJG53_004033 [Ovis ammon polii x Ovis aries]|uniref:Uncharacterized protein n=1 Tax=Ovis ammon polii x Ovis aries TaxID=2918886 RepID=A0ACB9V8J7_9CETA|nr:hypothetical protein MJG53_004033 [Ovis ammon polii x Ovis aries]